ncbi:MAG: YlxR family protein [Clostridia bacterium]
MKNQPLRMCVNCRQMLPKSGLVRLVKTEDNKIIVDKNGKMNGRGAYVCGCDACLEKMKKSKLLGRIFKTIVPEDIYEQIKEVSIGKRRES